MLAAAQTSLAVLRRTALAVSFRVAEHQILRSDVYAEAVVSAASNVGSAYLAVLHRRRHRFTRRHAFKRRSFAAFKASESFAFGRRSLGSIASDVRRAEFISAPSFLIAMIAPRSVGRTALDARFSATLALLRSPLRPRSSL